MKKLTTKAWTCLLCLALTAQPVLGLEASDAQESSWDFEGLAPEDAAPQGEMYQEDSWDLTEYEDILVGSSEEEDLFDDTLVLEDALLFEGNSADDEADLAFDDGSLEADFVGASSDFTADWSPILVDAVKKSMGLSETDSITKKACEDFTGELQVSRCELTDASLVKYFKNITALYISHNQLTTLDISKNTKLLRLGLHDNQVTAIDLSHQPDLEWLYAPFNQIESIDLSKVPKLKTLDICNNKLTKLDVSMLKNLEVLAINNNDISNLNLSGLMKLTDVGLGNNRLPSVESLKLSVNPVRFTFGPQRVQLDPSSKEAVCTLGGQGYASLANAILDVQDGQTIQVKKSFSFSEPIQIAVNKKFTIDGKKKTLTFTGSPQNPNHPDYAPAIKINGHCKANVTLKNINLVTNYDAMDAGYVGEGNVGACRVTIKGGSYKCSYFTNWGTLIIKSGTFEQVGDSSHALIWSDGPMYISGGTFKGNKGTAVQFSYKGSVTGGTFSSKEKGAISNFGGTLTIKDGTFTSSDSSPVFYTADKAKTKISGGTFNGSFLSQREGQITFSGGKCTGYLLATQGSLFTINKFTVNQKKPVGAAILVADGSEIIVKGGSFTSKKGAGYITSNGGKVTFTVKKPKKLFKVKTLKG